MATTSMNSVVTVLTPAQIKEKVEEALKQLDGLKKPTPIVKGWAKIAAHGRREHQQVVFRPVPAAPAMPKDAPPKFVYLGSQGAPQWSLVKPKKVSTPAIEAKKARRQQRIALKKEREHKAFLARNAARLRKMQRAFWTKCADSYTCQHNEIVVFRRPKYVPKPQRPPRKLRVDNRAAAKVQWQLLPPAPRSIFHLAKLQVKIEALQQKRQQADLLTRQLARESFIEEITQWGTLCMATGKPHTYLETEFEKVCSVCAHTIKIPLKTGEHEGGGIGSVARWVKDRTGWTHNPDRKPWWKRPLYDPDLVPKVDPCFGWCWPVTHKAEVASLSVYSPTTIRIGEHQMDIQKDPIGEVGSEQIMLGNVALEQEATTTVEAQVGASVADTLCATEVVDACPEIIERGLYLDTITWRSSDMHDTTLSSYNLISDIFRLLKDKRTPNLMMFEAYRFVRLDVELIFSANTTLFHTGMLQISVTYLKGMTQETSYYENVHTLSQRHHVLLNAGAGNEVSINVPFDYYKSFLYLDADNTEGGKDFATVLVKVLNPLKQASGDLTEVDVMVYAKLKKVNFTGMIPRSFKTFDHQMDILGPASRVVTALLADPNRDYPSVPGPVVRMQPQSSQSLCYGTNCDLPITSLRLDPSVQTPHPQKLVDFNIHKVKRVWGLINILNDVLTVDSTVGTTLWSTEVSPILPAKSVRKIENGAAFNPKNNTLLLPTYAMPPVSVLASMYGYWCGSLEFKFQVVQTKFHSARILVGFIPGKIPTNSKGEQVTITIDDLRNSMHAIYNIQDSNEFVYSVPYISHTPVQPRRFVNGTFGSNFPSIGTLYVMVANRLALSSSVPRQVSINVYMRGGPNLELYHPVAPSLVPGTYRSVKVRGVQGQFLANYFPVSIGTWHSWVIDGKNFPIYRYGDVTDHISQFRCNVFGVYDVVEPSTYTDSDGKTVRCRYMVPVKFDGYTYAVPVASEALAKQYVDRVGLKNFISGNKDIQLKSYGIIMNPKKNTDSEPVNSKFKDSFFSVVYAVFDHEMSMRDEADAVAIENVTAAGPLGRTLFGEKLCNLKDLARRYQFVGSYRKKDSDVHDNPLYTDIIIPVCPNYASIDEAPYDRLGTNPTALLATGFRGFRGSMRYKLIYRGDDATTIYVQHRFDAKPRVVEQKQYVHGLDDLIASGYATAVQVTKVNPIIDFEVPYYSIYNYLIVGKFKEDPNEHEKTIKCNGNLLISVDSSKRWTIDVWAAFADDASLHMFQGFPPMGYSSALPIDLIPEHPPPLFSRQRRESSDSFVRLGDHEGLLDYVPGATFIRNANTAVTNVNDVAGTLKSAISSVQETKTAVVNKSKDFLGFITSIPGLMLTLGEQVWQALLQMVQVYLNPTKKSLAVCIVSILLGICSHFKNYADALFKAILGLIQRKDAIAIVDSIMDDSDDEMWTDEEIKIASLHDDGMFTPPQRRKGEYIPKYDPKHSSYQRIGDHQMQTPDNPDDWVPIASLLVSAVSGACNKKVSLSDPKKLVTSAIGSIPDQARNTTYIMRYLAIIIALVKNTTEYVKKKLWPQLAELDVPDASITTWYTLACDLTDVTEYDSIRCNQEKVNQVYQEVKRGDSLVVVASASTDPKIRAVTSILRSKLSELRKVKQRLFEERICSTSYTTPFCLWVYGRPGIGKSVGGAKIRADLMRAANIRTTGDVSYTISPGKKHLDGLNTQPCVIFDDFGAINDSNTTPEVLQMYMEMISSEPYRPPMAALDEKKLVHNAELVYINSNFAYPRYECVADSAAFYRRRHAVVYMKVRGDPLDMREARNNGPVNQRNTPGLIPGSLNHLQFAFMDPSNETDEQNLQEENFLDYDEFIQVLIEKFTTHRNSMLAIAEERMESERDLRVQNENLNTTFAGIKNSITSSLFGTCAERVNAEHQMSGPQITEMSDTDEEIEVEDQDGNQIAPRIVPSWQFRRDGAGESSNVARKQALVRVGASVPLTSAPQQMLGDRHARAAALVSDFDDGTNTPDNLNTIIQSDEKVSDCNFALVQADHILAGTRIDTSVCKHNIFSTTMYYENGVFVGNGHAVGNTCCDARRFPECKWLDSANYKADMIAWWCQHEEEMKGKINIIREVHGNDITDRDIPPYFIELFAQVNKEQKLLADAEQSWLKYLQYLLTVKIPGIIASILNFVAKHWIAIAIIGYVSFLFSMMGLACAAGIEDIKGQRLRNARFAADKSIPMEDFHATRLEAWQHARVKRPSAPSPPLPPGMEHQIIPSGDSHTQRVGNARRITKQLRKADHQVEFNQRNKDCLRLLSGNTWFLCLVGIKDEIISEARVLALRAQKILVIRHYVEGFMKLMKDHPDYRLMLVRPSCILPYHPEALESVTYLRDDGTTSFGIMDGPSNMPLARDITRIIAPSGQHDSIDLENAVLGEFNMGDHPTTLVPTLFPVSCYISDVMANERDGMSAVVYQDAYFYPVAGRGMCGSVLVCDGALVGVHVCGWAGEGVSEPICRDWFSAQVSKEIIPLNPPELLPIEKAQLLLTSSNLPLGVCEPEFAHHESGKTKIVPSKIQGTFKIHTEPAPLTKHDPRLEGEHKGKSPMREGCEKHGQLVQEFPKKLLQEAFDDLSAHLNAVVTPARGKVGVLSLEDAVMGFPGRSEYQKMEMNTSEGYPWVSRRPPGARNKSWMFQFQNDPTTGVERLIGVNEELLAVLSVNDAMRRRNCRPFTVYTDCLKDARLPLEKCKRADKTRIFSISPVDHTIACRQYFMDFAASYQRSRFENECGVGIVVQGREWTDLYKYLDTNSKYIVCGDYSNFGPGLQSGVVRAAFKLIATWYTYHGSDAQATRVRNVLAEENINSLHQMLNVIYSTCGGAPSGNPLTVIINSLVNCLYVRMAWKSITGLPMSDFRNYVRLVTYGDDLIMSVKECVIEKFNNQTLQNFFDQYDVKYTDIDKGDGTIRKYCSISEASFLKRTWIPHPTRPTQFLACAEIASIEDCANWIRDCPDKILATEINATTCCDIAYSRGKEYHSMVVSRVREAWARRVLSKSKGYQPLKIRTWDELDALYYSDEWKGQPWTEHSKLMLSLG